MVTRDITIFQMQKKLKKKLKIRFWHFSCEYVVRFFISVGSQFAKKCEQKNKCRKGKVKMLSTFL
jgi:hypothetical protein